MSRAVMADGLAQQTAMQLDEYQRDNRRNRLDGEQRPKRRRCAPSKRRRRDERQDIGARPDTDLLPEDPIRAQGCRADRSKRDVPAP